MDKESEAKKQESELLSEVGEDTTKYGEFISSYFAWVSLPQQKGRVNELEEMTKKEEKIDKVRKNKINREKTIKRSFKGQRKSKNIFAK